MNHLSNAKSFIFNEKLDSRSLNSLYANDYSYIEEVFATTLQHFDADFEAIKIAFDAGDTEDLRKAVHKIKPTFGFVGLTAIQDSCREFEDLCEKSNSTDELKQEYKQIVTTLAESKDLLESEYRKLKDFNAASL